MLASDILSKFRKINFWYLKLAQTRYPQWLTGILGAASGVIGVLFITLPDRFAASSALVYLIGFLPPVAWGLIFTVIGVALVTTSIVNPNSSTVLCVILGLTFFLFAVVTVPSAFEGNATGLMTVFAATLGFMCLIGMFASIAPDIEAIIERGTKESSTRHNGQEE